MTPLTDNQVAAIATMTQAANDMNAGADKQECMDRFNAALNENSDEDFNLVSIIKAFRQLNPSLVNRYDDDPVVVALAERADLKALYASYTPKVKEILLKKGEA
jgi:hypothetical protein